MADTEFVDGDRGILTTKDREYLLGEVDISKYENPEKQEGVIQHRIRKRIKQGIKDFILIEKYLSEEEWNKILAEAKDFETNLKSEANNLDNTPDPDNHEYPDVLRGLHSGLKCIFTALAEVHGESHAVMFIEYNLKEVIQMQNVFEYDEFYYGDVDLQRDDFEDYTVDLIEVFGRFEDILESKDEADSQEEFVHLLNEALDELVESLPDMPTGDYVGLVDAMYATGRLSYREYMIIRQVMAAMIWDMKEPAISEAIQDWEWEEEL